jgi:hypothetical protein
MAGPQISIIFRIIVAAADSVRAFGSAQLVAIGELSARFVEAMQRRAV